MRIVVFGDSIAYGAWDTKGGWVERLKSMAHRQTVHSHGENKNQVINLGIGGDTSSGLLARINNEIIARVSASWPFIFIISIGTNDQRSIDGLPEVDVMQYEKNVIEIIAIAQQYTDKIIILGLPPLGLQVIDFKGQEYSDQRIQEYDTKLASIAGKNGLTYVSLRLEFEKHDTQKLHSYDNLHPNNDGHEIIAATIKPILNNMGVEF
jgi:acyl-CoA thioesterase-1